MYLQCKILFILRYSASSANQRAKVRVKFAKSTDLYKNLYEDKSNNESFENEQTLDTQKAKVSEKLLPMKKISNTPMSTSTNFTTINSDSFSENKLKSQNNNSNFTGNEIKSNKISRNGKLGTISEETKKMNADSDELSETSFNR